MSDLSRPWSAQAVAVELLDAITVPAWVYRDTGVLHANGAFLRLSGYTLKALQALSPLHVVVPDDRVAVARGTAACLRGNRESPACGLRLLTRDGTLRQVELTLRRVQWGMQSDGAGSSHAVLVTCVDLSDMQHVQGSLQAMSELLRQIVDGAPVASFVIDSQHRVTHWNSACERLTGSPASTLVGTDRAWRAFYGEQRPLLADLIVDGVDPEVLLRLYDGRAHRSELLPGAFEAEAFFPNFGPQGRWLYFTAAPLHDGNGCVIGAIETLQDVTQRRLAEEELTRHRNALEQLVGERTAELASSARELAAFIENASVGVLYTAQGVVQRCNRKLGEIFGLADGAAVGRPASGFFLQPADHAALGKMAFPLLSQGLPLHHEMWMRHSQGTPLWIQMSAYVADHLNTAAGTWWMLQDRTEMRAAQQELQARLGQLQETNRKLEEAQNQLLQSDKMASIGQLAAGVAHEINNPVGFVSSNLNTLRQYVQELLRLVDAYAGAHDAAPGDASASAAATASLAAARSSVELDYLREDLPQLLDESADGLARVKKIVQDLKDFSRVDQSDWQEADLNVGLESTLNVVRNEVKYRADVQMHLVPLPPVRCLAGQLNQVFMNLIVNASHAIAGHGVITLSSGVQDEWVWVQVDDTGCGMSEDVRRRIFEPFYTTKDVGKGTGLGLSLSFSIMQRHGGAIQVRSSPGVGSSFRVWVPLSGPAGPVPPGTQTSAPPAWS
jgi:PAS domain S-box-containing protein